MERTFDDAEDEPPIGQLPRHMRHRGFIACASQALADAEDAEHHFNSFIENAETIDDEAFEAASQAALAWQDLAMRVGEARKRRRHVKERLTTSWAAFKSSRLTG